MPPAALRSKITRRSNESFLGTVFNGEIIIPWSKGFSWKGPTTAPFLVPLSNISLYLLETPLPHGDY